MLTSKKTLLALLLGFNAFGLAACNLPTPKQKTAAAEEGQTSTDSEAATFNVEAMPNRSSVLESTTEGAFAIPTAKVFNFYACLKDVYYNKAIQGHKFKIDETGKTVTSDASGCLVWSENIEFNYLADSQYIKLDRHIRGTGLHKGVRTVSFAINPWSHGESLAPVMDVKNEDAIPRLVKSTKASGMALKGLSTDNTIRTRPLWMDEGNLVITEQKMTSKGVDILVEMRGKPTIQLTKMNGEVWLRPLTSGSFNVRLKFIHSYQEGGKEIHRLLAKTDLISAKMENGTLAVRSPLSLAAIPTRGQMVLGVELSPVDGPKGLTGFDGIYTLGDYDQIKGSSFLRLASQVAHDKDFSLDKYINADFPQVSTSDKDGGAGTFQQDTYQKPKVEVSPLEFRFIRVGEEKTATREVIMSVKACVKSGLDQKTTRAQSFKVTKFKQNATDETVQTTIKTDNNSCLNWEESVKFKYFDCQHYLKGSVQIENTDLGMNEKIDILINPWDEGGAIGRDLRYVDPSEKLALDCKAEQRPRTQVTLDNFNYNTLSYNYQVDNALNLTVVKKIQIRMEPRLLVYSNLYNGRGEIQRLRDGIYLLKTAVVRNRDYDSNNTYVTSAEKFVNVMSGQVNTDLTFTTQDLKALGNRNTMLVEIYPVDENKVEIKGESVTLKQAGAALDSAIDTASGLETPTFSGPVTLNIDEASRPLKITDASAVAPYLLNGKGNNNSASKGLVGEVIRQGQAAQLAALGQLQARMTSARVASDKNLALVNLNAMDANAELTKMVNIKATMTRFAIKKSDLQGIISNKTIPQETAQKLCAFWASEYLPSMHADKGGAVQEFLKTGFGTDCYHMVTKDPSRFFQIEKRMAVKEVGATQYLKGFNQGLTVGTSFSMAQNHTESFSRTFSLKAGISKKFFDLVSLAADYGISWSSSDSTANGNSVSVNTSTSMTVQQSMLRVRVNKYEQCAIIRLNPELFVKSKGWFGRKDYLSVLNSRLTESELADSVTRGLMICEGQVRTQPVDITENYYLVAQETGSAQMQDMGDDRNRNFFVALRSTNDFNRFVLAVKGQIKVPGSSDKEAAPDKDINATVEQLFKLNNPAIPGMYMMN